MNRKTISGIMSMLFLTSMLTLALNIQSVRAIGTIYIRADGSVDPPDAPIQHIGNVYTFTDNIYGKIIIERDNITIDGNNYALQGDGTTTGVDLFYRTNVTIINTYVKEFTEGISLFESNGTVLRGNTLTDNGYGVAIKTYSYGNIVEGNNITSNGLGLDIDVAFNNTISENTMSNNSQAIYMVDQSSGNLFNRNNLTGNGYGFLIDYAGFNTLRENVLTGNNKSFAVYGRYVSHFIQDIDTSNTVDGKPIYYWINQQDKDVPSDAGYVGIVNSTRIQVKNLNLRNNGQGVMFAYTTYSLIERNTMINSEIAVWLAWSNCSIINENNITSCSSIGISLVVSDNNTISKNTVENSDSMGICLATSKNNTISENTITHCNWKGIMLSNARNSNLTRNTITANSGIGIQLQLSKFNTLSGNVIANNGENGISLTQSSSNNIIKENTLTQNHASIGVSFCSGNTFFHNNFVNNTIQVFANYANTWDDGYPSGGNYWSDYAGFDVKRGPIQNLPGSDGIGDTPYVIDANNQDNYPLMKPYAGPHDIGITSITPYKTIIPQNREGEPLRFTELSIKVVNYGNSTETVNVAIFANSTLIGAFSPLFVLSRDSINLCIEWNPSLPYGNYTLTAVATAVPGETDTSDNTLTYPTTVKITIAGDYNGDGIVDIKDASLVGVWWMHPVPPAPANADINEDGIIDIKDASIIGANWQKHV